jgi:hypothetical protein
MAAVGGIAAAVGTVAAGAIGASASGKAASAEESYLNAALGFQEGVYNTATTNLSPWISGGQSALSSLESLYGLGGSSGGQGSGAAAAFKQFQGTPYYTFPLQQATDTMNQAAASKGLSLSGGQLASLGQYGAGYASSNFNNWISALNSLSNSGQTAATSLGQIGTSTGSQVGQTSSGLAAAAGSGIMGSAGSTASALQSLSQALGGGTSSSGTGSSYGSSSGLGSTTLGNIQNFLSNNFGIGSPSNPSNADLSGGSTTAGLY